MLVLGQGEWNNISIIFFDSVELTRCFSCAARNGIDPVIVSRANEIEKLARQGEDLAAVCAKLTIQEMNELEAAVCNTPFPILS